MIVYTFLLARWLGPDLYGIIAANYSLTALTAFVVNWGLDTWLLRQAPQSDNPIRLTGQVLIVKISLGLVWSLLLWGIVPAISPQIYLRQVLALVIVNTLLDAVINSLYVVLVATNRVKISSWIFMSARFIRLAVTIVLIFLGRKNIYEFVISRVLIDLIFTYLAWRNVKPILTQFQRHLINGIFTNALPYGWSELLGIVYFQADVNLISVLSSDEKLIGHYAIVVGLTNALTGIMQSALNPIIPVFTGLFEKQSRKLIRTAFITVVAFAFTGVILWLGITTFGKEVVQATLGKNYRISAEFWVALSPIFLLKPLSLCANAFLISANQQNRRLIPQALAVAVKIPLTILVFPVWQVIGVIWVYLVSEFILLVGYTVLVFWWYRSVWRKMDLQP
jgi:O-antigen/teichoic acid export membrane protein